MITEIRAPLIIAFDGQEHRLLENGIVVVRDDKIVHVGKTYSGQTDKKIEAKKRLIIPGLVNIHAHIAGCPYERGYRGDSSSRNLGNSDLYDLAPPFWKSYTKQDQVVAVKYSLAELLRGGVTTVVEMGSVDGIGDEEAVDMVGKSGIRAYLLKGHMSGGWYTRDGQNILYHNFDGEKWDEEPGFKQLEESLRFIKSCCGLHNDRVRSFLYPEQADTCSPALLKETRKVADENHLKIECHVSQSAVEFKEIMRRHGKTPIQFLADLGVLGDDFIAGHAIIVGGHSRSGYPDPWNRDLELLTRTHTNVAHCPTVFSRYGIAMETYSKYHAMGVNIGIGTDTFPQDVLREMHLASTLSKVIVGEPSIATSLDLFNSATLGGAKALKRPDIGRIAAGAKADLVMVRLDTFNMCPITDPVRILVQAATNSDVDAVMIDGEIVVEGSRVKNFDEEKTFEELQASMDRIRDRVHKHDRLGRTADQLMSPSLRKWEQP
ncbi:amidohydrolase family protein [Candidatus Bathyarchaeota archaeon]|nr:amidohydrolase family protein [Candidatus Bathyarchaeota archaeon]